MRARVLIKSNKCLLGLKHPNTRPDSDTVLFLYVGYYIVVYLQSYFLHCINTRQQEMVCHSLFLSGKVMSQMTDGCEAVCLHTGSYMFPFVHDVEF